jgi:HD-GYP domain-containing protein (c-di-GMP phosphodiesterase class II)
MKPSRHSASLFSQKLDRVAFTAYFLGAVVPLLALFVLLERFVLPATRDRLAWFGLIGAVVSIALLSLGAFLTLRTTARRSLAQIDRHNQRLSALLRVSGSLSGAEHGEVAAIAAASCAVELTGARAAFVLTRSQSGQPPSLLESAGADAAKLHERHADAIAQLARLVASEGRPALRGPRDAQGGDAPFAAAAVPLPGEAASQGALVVVDGGGRSFGSAEVDALSTLAGLASVALHNAELKEAQRNFFTHVTEILVHALDAHLNYHQGHGQRVAQYANRLGRALELDERRLQRLHFAALLHDIGMLRIDRNQPMNARTCAKHTVIGGRMLEPIRLWRDLAPMVVAHHERWDGGGYPNRLSGDAIPLESRIIAVCDAFDTMVSETSYKKPRPLAEAIHELEAGAGSQFDPELAATFVKLLKEGAIQTPQAA